MKTLSQILEDINAVLDLEATQPSGDEYDTRVNYANQIVWDVAAKGQLSEFKSEFQTTTSTLATIPLPADFREPQENPRLYFGGGWQEYPLKEVEQKYDLPAGEYYSYILGDPKNGYNLILNGVQPSDNLSFIYQKSPTGMTTGTDICELPDPQVVARGVEAYVLYSRGDERFPIAEQKYEAQVANMMGREMKGTTGGARSTKMTFKHPLARGI